MRTFDFSTIVETAWQAYTDDPMPIQSITDISVQVSTNHVYKIQFSSRKFIFAKLSFFGRYEHFKEDHAIINKLASKLEKPFHNFLAKALRKDRKVYTYRYRGMGLDVWVVFYQPIRIRKALPKRLAPDDIINLGEELARFHLACTQVAPTLPTSSKTLRSDIQDLQDELNTVEGQFEHRQHLQTIQDQCGRFLHNLDEVGYDQFPKIPVFVDWNIGNFSLDQEGHFFSRWDYDWFRVCSRVLDFYFFSRVSSDIGDKTVFHYLVDTLMEDRFLLFLKSYHAVYPLSEAEIRFIPEAYRFFILNYVIKYGRQFFHSFYSTRLQREAYEEYLPSLDKRFQVDTLLKALNL